MLEYVELIFSPKVCLIMAVCVVMASRRLEPLDTGAFALSPMAIFSFSTS